MAVVEYERKDHVATITINREEARNSINPEVAVRLADAWQEVRDNDDVRVAILTGAGDNTFCAGADLARLITLFTGARKPEDEWDEKVLSDPTLTNRTLLRGFDPVKPVIAAVNGYAIAGGLEIMIATDIRVAVPEAEFGLQEAKWGIFPAGGSTARLAKQIPFSAAMEIMLTAKLIKAERALALGLINKIVPRGQLMDAALEYAQAIADNGPLAIKAIRKSAWECLGLTDQEALQKELEHAMPIFATEDAREGPKAFKEKRKPVFKGK